MQITIPFDIGYEFWVPRVIPRHTTLTMIVDGVEWTRVEETLEIVVRHKQIQRIDLTVESVDKISVKYYCVNKAQAETDWPRIYDTEEMKFTDREEALLFARQWREQKNTHYYGVSGLDDEA